MADFDERELRLIQNCVTYAANDPAGLPGHNLMIIISMLVGGRLDAPGHYEVYEDGEGGFRWRFQGNNNEVIASGESYVNLEDAEHAVNLLRGSALATRRFLAP